MREKEETSRYQIHKEKEMWARLRASKDPYLVMLFKTSWGEEGDDVRVIQRPKRGQMDHNKPPPKPRTPMSLATAFSYPPQMTKSMHDGEKMPSRDQLDWAERILSEFNVNVASISHRVESITTHISVLKRQGKTKQAEQQREAMDVLLDAYRLTPKPSKKEKGAGGSPIESCKKAQRFAKSKKLANFSSATGPKSSVKELLANTQATLTSLPSATNSYAHLDFYDMVSYKQKQMRKRKENRRYPARGGDGDNDAGGDGGGAAPHDEDEANTDEKIRKKHHGPQCRYHPDNIHPTYKTSGFKAAFRFPRSELDTTAERSRSPRTPDIALPLVEDAVTDSQHFLQDAKPRLPPNLSSISLAKISSLPGHFERGEGDNCSCSTDAETVDTPLNAKVSGWKRSWHLTRARLEHDLELVLEERQKCKGEVSQSLRHLGQLANRAVLGGKTWARCRIRPSTGKVPPLRRSPTKLRNQDEHELQHDPEGSDNDNTEASGDDASSPHTNSNSIHNDDPDDPPQPLSTLRRPDASATILVASKQRIEKLTHVLGLMEEGLREVGTSRDSDLFRSRMAVVIDEGKKLLSAAGPRGVHVGFGAGEKRKLDRVTLTLKNLSSQYQRLIKVYDATLQRRQTPDLIVSNPTAPAWAQSMWSAAKKDISSEQSSRDKGQGLLGKVGTHFAAMGFPSTPQQRQFCDVLYEMIEANVPHNTGFIAELLARSGPAVLSREVQKAASFIAQELHLPAQTIAAVIKDAQRRHKAPPNTRCITNHPGATDLTDLNALMPCSGTPS